MRVRVLDAVDLMPLGDHLEELRKRLIIGLLGLAPVLVAALLVGRPVLAMLLHPVQSALRDADLPAVLQATHPLETFGSYMKVAFVLTVLVGSPWIIYQVWLFVTPGLYPSERRFVYILAPLSAVLSVASVAFLYYLMLPVILAFFISFGSTLGTERTATVPLPEGVTPSALVVLHGDPPDPAPGAMWVNTELRELRVNVGTSAAPVVLGHPLMSSSLIAQQYKVNDYVGFLLSLAMAFAVAFQMPVVVLLLGWVGLVDRKALTQYRRQAAFVCAILGALLTPADPVSMVLLAVPLYLLFELGVFLLLVLPASRVAGKGPGRGGAS